jgi:hypothetical protein
VRCRSTKEQDNIFAAVVDRQLRRVSYLGATIWDSSVIKTAEVIWVDIDARVGLPETGLAALGVQDTRHFTGGAPDIEDIFVG